MTIFRREMRAGLKPFLFWTLGLFVLVFVGIAKYQGVSAGGNSMAELTAQFPRVVQAMMGFAGVDVSTLPGYTAILTYYVLICAVIYAVHLGSSAVTRESVDKTYEFLFTKPCTRSRVLAMKLVSAWCWLFLFSLLNLIFSNAAVSTLGQHEDVGALNAAFSLSVFLTGSLFLGFSALAAAVSVRPEKGSLYGNLAFLYGFVAGVLYDMLDRPGLFRLFSPFKYFTNAELLDAHVSLFYAVLTVVLTGAFVWGTFRAFNKKDLL